ncbi:MAG: hypothetical protein FGM24_04510 [Candidatus Kapabacteria bacterium]|nr:hypothetical protein [Candidatus Kapabacteria bacterium]
MARIGDEIDPERPSVPQNAPERHKAAHKGAQERPIAINAPYVEIPALRPVDIRRMLRLSGHTQVELSRFMGRSRNYVNEKLATGQIPLRMIEALYMLLGHDMFWSAYDGRH